MLHPTQGLLPHKTTESHTVLNLSVGPYSLGVKTDAVLAVQQDVAVLAESVDRGTSTPLCDLRPALGGPTRSVVPFVLLVEAGSKRAAIGVDAVHHLSQQTATEAPRTSRVPSLGLRRPSLIKEAIHVGPLLLLLLDPSELVALAHEEANDASARRI